MWTNVLAPNEPPIGGQTTRTCSSGRPNTAAMSERTLNGVCVPVQSSSRSPFPAGETGVRLHRRVLGGRRSEGLLDDLVGLLEAALDVAVADAEEVAHVRALLGSQPEVGGVVVRDPVPIVHEDGALERLLEAEHGRQLLVLDVDEGERGLGLLRSLGRHGGHRVTGEAGADRARARSGRGSGSRTRPRSPTSAGVSATTPRGTAAASTRRTRACG